MADVGHAPGCRICIVYRHGTVVPAYGPDAKPEPADTYQNPAEALAQVEKTLMLVSDKMMQGQKKAERNIEKTETLIKYIK